MSAKKRRGKKDERKHAKGHTPLDRLNEKETLMHYNAVLMEDIKSKFELIIEGMESMRVEFDRQLEAIRNEFDQKLQIFRTDMDRRFSMMEKALHALNGPTSNPWAA